MHAYTGGGSAAAAPKLDPARGAQRERERPRPAGRRVERLVARLGPVAGRDRRDVALGGAHVPPAAASALGVAVGGAADRRRSRPRPSRGGCGGTPRPAGPSSRSRTTGGPAAREAVVGDLVLRRLAPVSTLAPRSTASATRVSTLRNPASSMSGPTLTPGSVPRPTGSDAMRSASRRPNSSMTEDCTYSRLAAVQASPMLRILAAIAPSTASSRSASSNTMNGAFPPSSNDVRRIFSAHCSSSNRPTFVDPVNDSFRARPDRISGSITGPASAAVMQLTAPAGTPASERMSISASIDSGVWCAGLITLVHPAAIAGPSLRVPIAIGKFHGVISRQGPTGWRATRKRDPPAGAVW